MFKNGIHVLSYYTRTRNETKRYTTKEMLNGKYLPTFILYQNDQNVIGPKTSRPNETKRYTRNQIHRPPEKKNNNV